MCMRVFLRVCVHVHTMHMCMCVCLGVCMHVHTVHSDACGGQKRASESLKLRHMGLGADLGVGIQTPILCRSSKLFLNYLSLPGILLVSNC